ncbi:MAG: hypothetical protein RL577_1561 [Bacteroidota bacterium]
MTFCQGEPKEVCRSDFMFLSLSISAMRRKDQGKFPNYFQILQQSLRNAHFCLFLQPRNGPKAKSEAHIRNGVVAQLVEQRTENPCVDGSIPPDTTKRPPIGGLFFMGFNLPTPFQVFNEAISVTLSGPFA